MLSDELKSQLLAFRAAREWEQFHNLRTLSASLVLEASELLELTQWTPDTELDQVQVAKRERIKEEVADIAILLTYLVNDLRIDLEQAVTTKLKANDRKYPVSVSRGRADKYDELPCSD
jgi:dCTP diphosphatase